MKRVIAVLTLALIASGCSNGSTAPSSSTPAPAVRVPILTFAPQTPTGPQTLFSLADAGETVPGQIAIAIRAANFGFPVLCVAFRGTIVYDPAVLAVVNYTEGDWMKQGGANATFSVAGGANQVAIRVDRPSTLSGASGSGTVLILRFKPATSTIIGSSALQWTDPHAYLADFSDVLKNTFGGTITVQ